MTTPRLWILGAADPEMAAIEKLLRDSGEKFAYACAVDTTGTHTRVHSGNAYAPRGFSFPADLDGWHHASSWGKATHYVECQPPEEYMVTGLVYVDHHRKGDPGFGRPPEEYLSASSIGQVVGALIELSVLSELALPRRQAGVCGDSTNGYYAENDASFRWEPGYQTAGGVTVLSCRDLRHIAAADHCLLAAYQGKCPGVDPEKLMAFRLIQRRQSCRECQGIGVVPDGTFGCQVCGSATHPDCHTSNERPCPKCTPSVILSDIAVARGILRERIAVQSAHADTGGGYPALGMSWEEMDTVKRVADLRGKAIPELPEAACREGIAFLADVADKGEGEGGRKKCVLQAAEPDLVKRFLEGRMVPGLMDYYGDPARGLAGGYYA